MEGIVLGGIVGIRVRQPPEGVGAPHQPVVAQSVEHRPHEDERAAPPDARLDEVTGHGIGHQGLDALLEVVEPAEDPTIVSAALGTSLPRALASLS